MIHKEKHCKLKKSVETGQVGDKTRCGRPEKLSTANENDGLKK